ncbi:MAG: UTP--glucose-1-phosphate uridylyltransferase GalU [Verrucomicrobiota bacterium]
MVDKAVIPAAGFGTRFLPASKSQPKEMLPIVDKPTIQYVVEEIVEAGIRDILMIIGKGKRAIEEHFDRNFELEQELEAKKKFEDLEEIRALSDMADVHFVWQKELRGLGDAIRCAKCHVGHNPFVVLLGDTLIGTNNGIPVTKSLIDIFNRNQSSVVALERVPQEKVSRYGIISGSSDDDQVYKINDFIEKPAADEAPTDLAIAGRYIFTPDIFDHLENLPPGKNNEIQITDAMRRMVRERDMYGFRFEGKRYDIGNKLDFLKTNIEFALNRDELREPLAEYMKSLM